MNRNGGVFRSETINSAIRRIYRAYNKEETLKDGCIKLKTKATSSKILRGRMVNYMAKNDIVEINELKNFSCDGYSFSDEFSDENKFVFVKSLISE